MQIICQHVEDEVVGERGDVVVTAADLGGPEGLNAVLGDFYRRVVDSFPPDERRQVTDLCETGLINWIPTLDPTIAPYTLRIDVEAPAQ